MVVQGEENLSRLVKGIDWGVHGEENVSDEEHEVQEWPKLDRPAVACALGVFAGPEAEVEAQLDQVGDVVGVGIRGGCFHGHNGVNYSQGDGSFQLDCGILDPIGFELTGEALVETSVSL